MGVIKSGTAAGRGAARVSFRDVEELAGEMLAEARRKAEALLGAAQVEADAVVASEGERGFAEGRMEGFTQGQAAGREQGLVEARAEHSRRLEDLERALTLAVEGFEESRRKLEADALADVIRLAVAIARRVTKVMGEINPGVARANVAEALRLVVHASSVRVLVNPAQRELIETEAAGLAAVFPRLKHVRVDADPGIAPGGCRLAAGSGIVDADLDAQLDRIVADLLPPGTEAPT